MTGVGSIRLDTRRLDEIARKLNTNAEGAVKSIAFQIEAVAKPLAPFKTGYLRNSIEARSVAPLLWWVQVGAEYAVYQEFGTYKMSAHPFLTPTCEQVSKQIGAEFKRELFK